MSFMDERGGEKGQVKETAIEIKREEENSMGIYSV